VADAVTGAATPGRVVATVDEKVDVATAAGVYRVAFVQPAGGRPMSAAAYLRGRREGA
jgi:methionyl-tRNA formyltransferase